MKLVLRAALHAPTQHMSVPVASQGIFSGAIIFAIPRAFLELLKTVHHELVTLVLRSA